MNSEEKQLYMVRGKAQVVMPSPDELSIVFLVYQRLAGILQDAQDDDAAQGEEFEDWREQLELPDMVGMKVLARNAQLSPSQLESVFDILDEMEDILDDGDSDDRFGTEGWRHRMGWD